MKKLVICSCIIRGRREPIIPFVVLRLWVQSQRAPASLRRGTRVPLMWAAMTRSMAPTSFPPMNTTGTAALPATAAPPPPRIRARARSISPPRGSSSSSTTMGLTPMPQKSRFTAWHMQQVLTLKMTTALSPASRSTRSSASIVAPLAAATYPHASAAADAAW
ncbi:unnamed protein product [Musa acuminata subsp. malaccensis]|uniref:(wild Malaysian banana) hypothetical protein n=1 Tax=Musa acuminata subsp. malaccensis TaxID=214687 RepID=A0A8D7FBG3_MUSAM|nr:unnamed protein product [Musa acuminata subsp. malaccensis]